MITILFKIEITVAETITLGPADTFKEDQILEVLKRELFKTKMKQKPCSTSLIFQWQLTCFSMTDAIVIHANPSNLTTKGYQLLVPLPKVLFKVLKIQTCKNF